MLFDCNVLAYRIQHSGKAILTQNVSLNYLPLRPRSKSDLKILWKDKIDPLAPMRPWVGEPLPLISSLPHQNDQIATEF